MTQQLTESRKCNGCNKELNPSSHPNKKLCGECAYDRVKSRSKIRYHTSQGLLSKRALVRRDHVKYLEENCYDIPNLIRKLIEDFINKQQGLN